MQRFSILLLGIVLSLPLLGKDTPKFHKVAALPGDGIISMLRRYQLEKYSCNFDQFYKLNKIKRNASLSAGKEYFVPVLIYSFDGKTIRSSVGIDDWDKAVRIQQYNEKMLEMQLRPQSYKESKLLWVPYHELNCPQPDLDIPAPVSAEPEAKTGERTFPIFGEAFAHTPLVSNKLKGSVFFISSGHGGPDPGAIGKRWKKNLCEDEYAYDVALRLCRLLVSHGATAYMVIRDDDGIRQDEYLPCDTDETVWGGTKLPFNQKARLFQRSDLINELYEKHRLQGVAKQTAIEIHVDSRSKGERIDAFFYHHADSEAGKKLAEKLQKVFKQKYQQYQQGRGYQGSVETRDLHMLRECKPRAVFVELANIRNYSDQQRIVLPKNRQLLAEWLFEGLND